LLGYKGYKIKEFFLNYLQNNSNIEINMKTNSVKFFDKVSDNWKITLLDTGEKTMTGGRIKEAQKIVGNEIVKTKPNMGDLIEPNKAEKNDNFKMCLYLIFLFSYILFR
jgi:NDP-sugar pyrophosphorylase family protein